MIETSKDMALEALLEAANNGVQNISTALIKAIYQVEKVHQYSHERKTPVDV